MHGYLSLLSNGSGRLILPKARSFSEAWKENPVSHTSSEVSVFKPVNELVQIFGSPALAGDEKLQDYERFFATIHAAMNPPDSVGWLFVKDVTDWSWEIRRERIIKAATIKYYVKEIIGELIKSELAPSDQFENANFLVFEAGESLSSWACDPKARAEIDQQLAAKGYDASYVLAQAYMRGAAPIEAIDKRIAFHELRRSAALKEAGIWSDVVLRRLEKAIPEVVDGEFTEAQEGD
jgi:hypothetical protein